MALVRIPGTTNQIEDKAVPKSELAPAKKVEPAVTVSAKTDYRKQSDETARGKTICTLYAAAVQSYYLSNCAQSLEHFHELVDQEVARGLALSFMERALPESK